MIGLCLGMVVVGLAISLPSSWRLMVWGRHRGRMDRPDEESHKGHDREVPNTGGIAIFGAVVVPVALGMACVWLIDLRGWPGWLGAVSEQAEGLRRQTPLALTLLGALAVLHVLGLIDDRRGLNPMLKLLMQLAVAAVLAGPMHIRIFQFLENHGPAGIAASVVLSVLWLVAITNAMNMLDNMDGLAAGVGAIIAAFYLAATLLGGQWFVAALGGLLLGSLLGFLVFNFPPARLFMGDAGSLVVGMLVAVISVQTTYFLSPPDDNGVLSAQLPAVAVGAQDASWYGTLMPLVILAVPLYDLVSVTFIRIRNGKNPFVGDLNHLSHRLVRRGMSRSTAVLLIWLATAATGLGGVMFNTLKPWQALIVAAQTAAVVAVLGLLERGGE